MTGIKDAGYHCQENDRKIFLKIGIKKIVHIFLVNKLILLSKQIGRQERRRVHT